MAPVRAGFVGCGTHAHMNLYPSLRFADCTLVAASDLYEERRERASRVHGADRVYAEYGEMLDAEELDAVFVSGPPKLHHEAALRAMERGLHVFVEKPPSETLAQAREMLRVSRETGCICMVGFMKRFAQKYVMAKQIAEREEFGALSHLLLRYSFNVSTDRQGFLAGMCSHPLDLARHFMGDYGRMHAEWGQGASGLWLSLNVRFRSGATGTLIMSGQASAVVERLELTGEGVMVVVDDVATLEYYPPAEKRWRPAKKVVHRPNMALQSDENNSLTVQGYAGEVRAFIEAVAGGTPPPCATIEDGVAMMEIVELLASGRSGVFEPGG